MPLCRKKCGGRHLFLLEFCHIRIRISTVSVEEVPDGEGDTMDDKRIVELLLERSETALHEVSVRYAGVCRGVLRSLLNDPRDVEECLDDVLLALWNSVPPNQPRNLNTYLCRLARRTGIDRLRYNTRQKRNAVWTVMLSELGDSLPDETPQTERADAGRLRAVLTDFLNGLDAETRVLFLRRYVYAETVPELAARFGISENYASVRLYRARKKLKTVLEKEGIGI